MSITNLQDLQMLGETRGASDDDVIHKTCQYIEIAECSWHTSLRVPCSSAVTSRLVLVIRYFNVSDSAMDLLFPPSTSPPNILYQ